MRNSRAVSMLFQHIFVNRSFACRKPRNTRLYKPPRHNRIRPSFGSEKPAEMAFLVRLLLFAGQCYDLAAQ
jgi:hypothetical protein